MKHFSVLVYSYINTRENWKNSKLCEHPIRTLYPNKIIVSNKLLGLSRLGGWGLAQGSFYMHEMTIPVTIGIIKCCDQ